jgi:hypothetical protein
VLEAFEILGTIRSVEVIAVGRGVESRGRLIKLYGAGRWRKMKGVARVRLRSGAVRLSELHWYEAHGRGRFEFKRKRDVSEP